MDSWDPDNYILFFMKVYAYMFPSNFSSKQGFEHYELFCLRNKCLNSECVEKFKSDIIFFLRQSPSWVVDLSPQFMWQKESNFDKK